MYILILRNVVFFAMTLPFNLYYFVRIIGQEKFTASLTSRVFFYYEGLTSKLLDFLLIPAGGKIASILISEILYTIMN